MTSALSIQCLPVVEDKKELYELVDKAIAVIEKSGFPYVVGPFETTIEGELDQIWQVAYEAHKVILEESRGTVISYIKLASGNNLGSTAEKITKYQ